MVRRNFVSSSIDILQILQNIEIVNVKEYLEEKLKEEGEVNVVQELSKIEDVKTSAINYIKFYKLCMNCDDENHKIKEFL